MTNESFFQGKKVVHKMCVKIIFVLKNENWKKNIFFLGKKSRMKKSPTFFYNLPYESYEKSPVMKFKLYLGR